jgi:folate-binding protein YgfZ
MASIWWIDDYQAITEGVGSVELSDWSRIELSGADRGRLLNTLATNRLDDLVPGRSRETFLTDVKGHVVAHGIVIAENNDWSFLTAAPRGDVITAHINRYIIRENVQVADRSIQTALWYLGGSRAEAFLVEMGITAPRETCEHIAGAIGRAQVTVCRVEMASPVGFLIMAPREQARAVAGALEEAGAKTCVHEAFDAARIEWGWPLDRIDISLDNLPQEVGRNDQAISFTKGCYLGQETVARIDSRGHVNKRLAVVRFPAGNVAPSATLLIDGKTVGNTTSSGYSPRFDCPIALAYVRHEWAEPGTSLDSSIGPAEIVAPRRLDQVVPPQSNPH